MLILSALCMSACSTTPEAPAAANNAAGTAQTETTANQSRVCAREPITGSHMSRCGPPSNVESLTRDDLQRIQTRTNNMPMEPGTTRGR